MKIINKIKCLLGLHHYYKVRVLTLQTDLVGCRHCNKYFGMNHAVRIFLKFDKDMYNLYTDNFKIKGLKKYITK